MTSNLIMNRFPDYTHSILNLSNSILEHYDVPHNHSTLPEVMEKLRRSPKTVVLMVFDGMGSSILARHLPENSFLRRHKIGDLTSVFPSTTVAATAAIQSGHSPAELGRLGWAMYFMEADDIVSCFYNKSQTTGKTASFRHFYAQEALYYPSIWRKIKNRHPEMNTGFLSYLSLNYVPSLSALDLRIRSYNHSKKNSFLYTYWQNPDTLLHRNGTSHPAVTEFLTLLDKKIETMCRHLKDATVIITADHSQIDTRYEYLEDYPELCSMLVRHPALEYRAAALYVKDEYKDIFADTFRRTFGDKFMLLTHQEMMKHRIFGPGVPHPRAEEFMGDFISVAAGEWNLAYHRPKDNEKAPYIGNHAGIHPDEMTVPLIVIET